MTESSTTATTDQIIANAMGQSADIRLREATYEQGPIASYWDLAVRIGAAVEKGDSVTASRHIQGASAMLDELETFDVPRRRAELHTLIDAVNELPAPSRPGAVALGYSVGDAE